MTTTDSPFDSKDWLKSFEEFVSYLRIPSKEVANEDFIAGGGVPLDLWDSQRMYMREVATGLQKGQRSFTCLKNRQAGISTVSLAIDLFWLWMFPGIPGVLVTDSASNRMKFRFLLKAYVTSLPKRVVGQFGIKKGQDNLEGMGFTNGSTLDLLVAGKRVNKTLGEGRGYALAHMTEVANYGSHEGLRSFIETLAEHHPHRLFMAESTAKGFNHWREMCEEAQRDKFTKRFFFIGWWAKELNAISLKGPPPQPQLYREYGLYPPTPEESEKMALVLKKHNHAITQEQLAWYRWRAADGAGTVADLHQNQPWTADEAFVMTGYSFFPIRSLVQYQEAIRNYDNGEGEKPGLRYRGYRFFLGERFVDSKMEQVFTTDQVELRVWEEPDEHGTYVIGCDPAMGRNEKRDRHCLDAETEILTKEGWKHYDEIRVGDLAVCFDMSNEKNPYVYCSIQDVIVREHDGPMYHFTSDGLDCLATLEHRVVQRMYDGRKLEWRPWSFKTAKEIGEGATQRVAPTGGSPLGQGIPELSLDMCRALGWMMTDGYFYGRPKREKLLRVKHHRGSLLLVQSKATVKNGTHICKVMDEILFRLCKPTRRETKNNIIWRILANDVEQFTRWLDIDDIHKIPRSLLENVSREQAEALFLGLLEGDGGWDKNARKWVKFCPGHATALADGFQELALKLGYSATRTIQKGGMKDGKPTKEQWLVRLAYRKNHTLKAGPYKPVQYKGTVWCVTVPTGAFVARRRGKAFVTGNCVSVWRCYADKLEQVAEYAHNNIDTRQCAWVLAYLAGAYRSACLNVEVQGGWGMAVLSELKTVKQLLNSEVYADSVRDLEWEDFLAQARFFIYRKYDSMNAAGNIINFKTHTSIKFEVMNQFRDSLAKNALIIRSIPLLDEMREVQQSEMEIGAPDPLKDDRVFAAVLANRTWIDMVQPSMIAMNATYDRVWAGALNEETQVEGFANKIVENFFKRREELELAHDPRPKWMVERGLV